MLALLLTLTLAPPQELVVPSPLLVVHAGWRLEEVIPSEERVTARDHDVLGRVITTFVWDKPWMTCGVEGDTDANVFAAHLSDRYLCRSPWTAREDRTEWFDQRHDDLALHPGWNGGQVVYGSICMTPAVEFETIQVLGTQPSSERIDLFTLRYEQEKQIRFFAREPVVEARYPKTFLPGNIRASFDDAYLFEDVYSGCCYRLTRVSETRSPSPLVRMASEMDLLAQSGTFGEAELLKGLSHESGALRAAAVRAFESKLENASDSAFRALLDRVSGNDESYLWQVACSLGAIAHTPRGLQTMEDLLTDHPEDSSVRTAVRSGLEGRELAMLTRLLRRTEWQAEDQDRRDTLRGLINDVLASGKRGECKELIRLGFSESTLNWHREVFAQAFASAGFRNSEKQSREAFLERMLTLFSLKSEKQAAAFERGKTLYESSCIECHLSSGMGRSADIPSLRVLQKRLDDRLIPHYERKEVSKRLFDEGLEAVVHDSPKCETLALRGGTDQEWHDLSVYLKQEWYPVER